MRGGMIELAWGHLVHQKGSPLSAWYRSRTADARGGTRKTMIVALARKLLIVPWRRHDRPDAGGPAASPGGVTTTVLLQASVTTMLDL